MVSKSIKGKKAGGIKKAKKAKIKVAKVPEDKKKRFKSIAERLKKVDKELYLIEKDLRESTDSKIVAEDLKDIERRLLLMHEDRKPKTTEIAGFYKNFVLKCMECNKEFEHKAHVTPVKGNAVCLGCGKVHEIVITPSSKYYHIDFPSTIKVLKELSAEE